MATARRARAEIAAAVSDRAAAASVPAATAVSSAASARQARAAAARSASPGCGGHSSSTAGIETTQAISQPSSRSPTGAPGTGTITASTKASSVAVVPAAK